MGRLDGEVAVVAGSGSGIGKAIAKAFAMEDASVVINGRHTKEIDLVCREIKEHGGDAIPVKADVTRAVDVQRLFGEALNTFGKVDIMVDCVGLHYFKPFLETTFFNWNRVFRANINSAFLCAKAAGDAMAPRGKGSVIFISSIAAFTGMPNRAPYCASKAAIVALTKVLASEWGGIGIRVNCIAPGFVLTEKVKSTVQSGHDLDAELVARAPLARRVLPGEVANLAVFLASTHSSAITGQTIIADGGWTVA